MPSSRSDAGSWRFVRAVSSSIAAAALLASCGERGTTEPTFEVMPTGGYADVATAVFMEDLREITVPTYDGSGQAVHPDIVAFQTPWHGARYWLTVTPYPQSNQAFENPSILSSDDGMHVGPPGGLRNPVVPHRGRASDYNSDPELLYEPQTDRLVLFHRFVDRNTNTIGVSTSRDGVTWTSEGSPFWVRRHQAVSPTAAPRPGAAARMWYVEAGKKGCHATSTRVMMRTATDSSGRLTATRWAGPAATDIAIPGYVPWHIKARWVPGKGEYWMLVSAFPEGRDGCTTDDLFFARSADGLHWKTYTEPILHHEDRAWTAAAVYRSSFIYDAARDALALWVSARGRDGVWHVGYARLRYDAMMSALEAGQRLSPRPATVFSVTDLPGGEQP